MKKIFPDYKTYTREEEHNVFLKIRAGEDAAKKLKAAAPEERMNLEKIVEEGRFAREDMLLHNIRLAYDYMLKYCVTFIEKRPDCRDDLLMWIILGIDHAIDLYDVNSGNKFSTYAYPWMRHHANQYMYRESYILGYYNRIYTDIDRYKKYSHEYQKSTGKRPDDKTVISELKISKKTLEIVKQALKMQVDLDYEFDDDLTVGDCISSDYDLEQSVADKLMNDEIKEKLAVLNVKERKMVELHYGFGNNEPCSVREAEEKIGVNRGVGSMLLERARKKLLLSLDKSYAYCC